MPPNAGAFRPTGGAKGGTPHPPLLCTRLRPTDGGGWRRQHGCRGWVQSSAVLLRKYWRWRCGARSVDVQLPPLRASVPHHPPHPRRLRTLFSESVSVSTTEQTCHWPVGESHLQRKAACESEPLWSAETTLSARVSHLLQACPRKWSGRS